MVDLITCDKAVELYDDFYNRDYNLAGWSGWAGHLGSDEYVEVTLLAYPDPDDGRPMITLSEKHMTKEEWKKFDLYYIY
jgi:hypothetical protein